jgi:hypothetical protein
VRIPTCKLQLVPDICKLNGHGKGRSKRHLVSRGSSSELPMKSVEVVKITQRQYTVISGIIFVSTRGSDPDLPRSIAVISSARERVAVRFSCFHGILGLSFES